jgi:hypothetical protein
VLDSIKLFCAGIEALIAATAFVARELISACVTFPSNAVKMSETVWMSARSRATSFEYSVTAGMGEGRTTGGAGISVGRLGVEFDAGVGRSDGSVGSPGGREGVTDGVLVGSSRDNGNEGSFTGEIGGRIPAFRDCQCDEEQLGCLMETYLAKSQSEQQ